MTMMINKTTAHMEGEPFVRSAVAGRREKTDVAAATVKKASVPYELLLSDNAKQMAAKSPRFDKPETLTPIRYEARLAKAEESAISPIGKQEPFGMENVKASERVEAPSVTFERAIAKFVGEKRAEQYAREAWRKNFLKQKTCGLHLAPYEPKYKNIDQELVDAFRNMDETIANLRRGDGATTAKLIGLLGGKDKALDFVKEFAGKDMGLLPN